MSYCSAMNAIEVRGLEVSYGDIHAVRGIDLDVAEGEILAFLGPNGAGKTSTVEVLEGFRSRASGSVSVLGIDPAHAPRYWYEDIGIVLQESSPDGDLTARETVQLFASYYTSPRPIDDVLDLVGLAEHGAQRANKLSGGQQRRLDLALALVGDPKLVFLDEPTTGFDPSARRDAWGMIEELRGLGATVLLTTHYMDEAEHLADRIAVISDGLIVAEGTKDELLKIANLDTIISWDPLELPLTAVQGATLVGSRASLVTKEVTVAVGSLLAAASAANSAVESLSVTPPDLEDIYLHLTAATAQ